MDSLWKEMESRRKPFEPSFSGDPWAGLWGVPYAGQRCFLCVSESDEQDMNLVCLPRDLGHDY